MHKDSWYEFKNAEDIGYEIPFTRHFYSFVPPRSSDLILSELKELEMKETKIMKDLFGDE